ncbi:MAG TPA: hypothetical protein VGD04_04360 [Methylophilus sp.]
MNSLNLAVIVSAAALLVSGLASAADAHNPNMHNQNFAKRPYAQPLPESAYQKADTFEGATLVRGEVSEDGNATEHKQQAQRLNNLSKRPY